MTARPPPVPERIFHLCPASALHNDMAAEHYLPASLGSEGFVHATVEMATVLAVADDYFATCSEPLWVMVIATAALTVPVHMEAPAPSAGGRRHLAMSQYFPHIYGPVDRLAIVAMGCLTRSDMGYRWPEDFVELDSLLADDPPTGDRL